MPKLACALEYQLTDAADRQVTAMIIITVQPLEEVRTPILHTNINRKNSFPKALVYSQRGSSLFLALDQ